MSEDDNVFTRFQFRNEAIDLIFILIWLEWQINVAMDGRHIRTTRTTNLIDAPSRWPVDLSNRLLIVSGASEHFQLERTIRTDTFGC